MGCCSADSDEDEPRPTADDKNLAQERHCTDPICLVIFLLYAVAFSSFNVFVIWNSNARTIRHGRDSDGNVCGVTKGFKDDKYAWYPTLREDMRFVAISQRKKVKAICVPSCPTVDTIYTVPNTAEEYYVREKSKKLFGRCIPVPAENVFTKEEVCVYPRCINTDQRKHCGPQLLGFQEYWFLKRPSQKLFDIWTILDPAGSRQVETFFDGTPPDASDECKEKANVQIAVRLSSADSILQKVQDWTFWIVQAATLDQNKWLIIGLGLGGALVLVLLVMFLYSYLIKVTFCILTVALLLGCLILEYVFFVKGGWATGRSGARIFKVLDKATGRDSSQGKSKFQQDLLDYDPDVRRLFQALALADFLVIAFICCLICYLWPKLKTIIALTRESANALLSLCPIFIAPFIFLCLVGLLGIAFMFSMAGLFTFDWEKLGMAKNHEVWLGLLIITSFLWAYYFLCGLRTLVVSIAVSSWFFERCDPEGDLMKRRGGCCGVLSAVYGALRYHSGTVAFGSFAIAISKIPGMMLEYIASRMQSLGENVPCLCILRCLMYLWEKCVQYLTVLAYVNTAITGKPFCKAAGNSIRLVMEYPLQCALNAFALWALGAISIFLVPALLVVISYPIVKDNWLGAAMTIAVMSYIVTRLMLGVFSDAVTTMFFCALRDEEHFGGKYSPPLLREAFGFDEDSIENDEEIVKQTELAQTTRPLMDQDARKKTTSCENSDSTDEG